MKVIYKKDIEHLKNSYKFYNPKIKELGLPVRMYHSKSNITWLNTDDLEETLYLVSKTTAKKIKEPITDDEPIYGFTKVQNGYTALYNRPNAVDKISKDFIYQIPEEKVVKEIKTIIREYSFLLEIYKLFKELESKRIKFHAEYYLDDYYNNYIVYLIHIEDFIENNKIKYLQSIIRIGNIREFCIQDVVNIIEETDYPVEVDIHNVDEFNYNKRYFISLKNGAKIHLTYKSE